MAKEITWDVSRELPKYKKSGPAALINCASGPIETVELGATTGVSSDEGPWETTRLVSFIVREGWANGWVPGLNRLSIHLDADRHWIGNDMGLGIIAQLDELAQQLRVPMIKLIRTRSSTNQRRTLEPSTDQQHVGDHQIEVVFDAGTPQTGLTSPMRFQRLPGSPSRMKQTLFMTMKSIRVATFNWAWLHVVVGLAFVMFGVVSAIDRGGLESDLVAIGIGLVILIVAFRHKCWIEFGQAVKVRGFFGTKTHDWSEVDSIEFRFPCGDDAALVRLSIRNSSFNNGETGGFSFSDLYEIVKTLEVGLFNRKNDIREAAVIGLGKVGCMECHTSEGQGYGDFIRYRSESFAIARLGIILQLEKAVEDPDGSVRSAAATAIRAINAKIKEEDETDEVLWT